jgi:hypothetical protein
MRAWLKNSFSDASSSAGATFSGYVRRTKCRSSILEQGPGEAKGVSGRAHVFL